MDPKERAAHIYNRCLVYINAANGDALKMSTKACAYICVDELMKDAKENWNDDERNYNHSLHYRYWNKVKKAIQKI